MNVNDIIKEEIKILQERHQDIFTINDLAGILKRMGYEGSSIEILNNLLITAFKDDGDNGVINAYKQISGVEIESVSRGRYMFKNLYDPNQE